MLEIYPLTTKVSIQRPGAGLRLTQSGVRLPAHRRDPRTLVVKEYSNIGDKSRNVPHVRHSWWTLPTRSCNRRNTAPDSRLCRRGEISISRSSSSCPTWPAAKSVCRQLGQLEHVPEKWEPVFRRNMLQIVAALRADQIAGRIKTPSSSAANIPAFRRPRPDALRAVGVLRGSRGRAVPASASGRFGHSLVPHRPGRLRAHGLN